MKDQPVPRACDRWMKKATTDRLEGTEGVLDHYSRDVELSPGQDAEGAFRVLEKQLLTYRIFPPRLMRAEVCSDDGRIHEGTTIVQHVALGPLRLEAAVRVVRVWRNRDGDAEEIGFTYATLQGHPERGISTFRIRRSDQGHITFLIDARSRPGSLLTRLTRPFARRFQRQATEAALAHFTAASA
jgi:uncharacterized protein (UPF0548 family)